jgi:hypothetical protein
MLVIGASLSGLGLLVFLPHETPGSLKNFFRRYAPITYGVTYAVDRGLPNDLAFYSYAIPLFVDSELIICRRLSILNACSFIGRVFPNIATQYLGTLNVLITAFSLSSLGLFLWITAKSTTGVIIFYAYFGIVSGKLTFPSGILLYYRD